jgi:hypothetical protein
MSFWPRVLASAVASLPLLACATCLGVEGVTFEVVGERHVLLSRESKNLAILIVNHPMYEGGYKGNLPRDAALNVRFFSPTVCSGQRLQINNQLVQINTIQLIPK